MGILDIFRGGTPDGSPASDPYFDGKIMDEIFEKKEAADLPDFFEAVRMLGTSEKKVWQSADPNSFMKDGKINFLHLNDSGKFTLTVIKPGSKTTLEAQIPIDGVAQVREKLKGMKDWDKNTSAETWDKADGDKDGNTYMFNRYLTLQENEGLIWKLQWEGRHKNKGNIVEVRDVFRFIKVPPIILPKS